MSSEGVALNNVKIQTFVFFDLEASGLIQGSQMPKITEMSLVATSRDSLLDKKGMPRVMHKLTIPLQPLKPIPLEVSQITGLYNDLLEHEKPFDQQIYDLLNSFIGRLYLPICFVAHNGNGFDYPLILSELNRIGKGLSKNILCVDSLLAFKNYFYQNDSQACANKKVLQSGDKDSEFPDDGLDEELVRVLESVELASSTHVENECFDDVELNHVSARQKLNETTPSQKITGASNMNPSKSFKRKPVLAAKRQLPFTKGGPRNFKLQTVYEHLVGQIPPNSHCAEADCLAMLTCVMKMSEFFVDWADNNASPLAQFDMNA